jgi:hypothetical protein
MTINFDRMRELLEDIENENHEGGRPMQLRHISTLLVLIVDAIESAMKLELTTPEMPPFPQPTGRLLESMPKLPDKTNCGAESIIGGLRCCLPAGHIGAHADGAAGRFFTDRQTKRKP